MKSKRDEIIFEEEKLFYIKKIIREMNKELDAIIVEGKRDEDAFLSLGFEKKIIKCSSKDLEEIEKDIKRLKKENSKIKIAILTDFDEKGRNLNKKIKAYLQSKGFIIENFYRNKIKEIAFDIREIEDLRKRFVNLDKIFLKMFL